MSIEHLPNRDAIEDMRESRNTAHVAHAVNWAITTQQMEATEMYAALAAIFWQRSEGNREIEIVLDAYIESKKEKAA